MKKLLTLSLAVTLGLGLSNAANAITVNGDLSDWGLTNQWTPSGNVNGQGAGTYQYNGLTIYYTVEDYTSGNGFIGPGWGGQAYDAEALYVTWDAANLYIALVTGHYPNTKQEGGDYAAGDFALNFWSGTNDNTYEFGIRTPHLSNNLDQHPAGVYRTIGLSDWVLSPYWGDQLPAEQRVTSLNLQSSNLEKPESLVGSADMFIKQGPDTIGGGLDTHWIYEVSVPIYIFKDFLKPDVELDVRWTMNCANDIIVVKDDPPVRVDEPPVWALLGLTLPAMFWRRRRSVR